MDQRLGHVKKLQSHHRSLDFVHWIERDIQLNCVLFKLSWNKPHDINNSKLIVHNASSQE